MSLRTYVEIRIDAALGHSGNADFWGQRVALTDREKEYTKMIQDNRLAELPIEKTFLTHAWAVGWELL